MQVRSVEDDRALHTARRFHFTYVTEEWLSFVQWRTDAETYPHLFMSLIIDFCEKVPLLHQVPFVKSWLRKCNRFSTTIIGLLDHGHKQYFYYYLPFCWPQDPNLVLSVLWTHLENQFLSSPNRARPPTLYLQADNKVAENKSAFTFCFAVLLV